MLITDLNNSFINYECRIEVFHRLRPRKYNYKEYYNKYECSISDKFDQYICSHRTFIYRSFVNLIQISIK